MGVACMPRPQPERCEAMADHIVALSGAAHEGRAAEIAEGVAAQRRAALVDGCLSEGTVAEVACVLEAEVLDDVQACAPRR